MQKIIGLSAFVMGMSGQIAQIILIREFLIIFSGNEFYVGIVLSNWLLLEAFGAFISVKLIKRKERIKGFILTTILFCVSYCVSIFMVRMVKPVLQISVGENVELCSAFFSSFFILSFVSALHGALFPYTCDIYTVFTEQKGVPAGKIYAYETVGTIVGGITVTYIFISFFDSFKTAFIVSSLNCLISSLLVYKVERPSRVFSFLCLGLAAFFGILAIHSDRIHWYSIKKQWSNLNVIHYENSKYGNICVLESEGQYILFQDGVPQVFLPFPDTIALEELVHIPLLCHENPKNILIVGTGGGGTINEILKHPTVENVQYVELDPLFLHILRRFTTPLTEAEFLSPKLKVAYADGRFYISETREKYDVILIGIKTPSTLEANRLFTKEFFSTIKNRLTEKGIVVTRIPFSVRYTNEELRDMVRTFFCTLKATFKHVRPFPGEGTNIFLSSDSDLVLRLDKETVLKRIRERNLFFSVDIPWYIEQKLHKGWEAWFYAFVGEKCEAINSDLHPSLVFHTVLYLQSILSPSMAKILRTLNSVGTRSIIGIIIGSFIAYLVLKGLRGKEDRSFVVIPILTTGFYGMVVELIILFSFQSMFGYVFSWVGLLISAYMAGAAFGAYLFSLHEIRRSLSLKLFAFIELVLIAFSLLCPLVIDLARMYLPLSLLKALFLFLSFKGGFIIGTQFPLANVIYIGDGEDYTKTAALLYAADLSGGFVAGVLAGVWLIPSLGINETFHILALMKLVSGCVFVVEFLVKGLKLK